MSAHRLGFARAKQRNFSGSEANSDEPRTISPANKVASKSAKKVVVAEVTEATVEIRY